MKRKATAVYNIKLHDGKWYVIGYCGGGHWMPVSDGYDTRDKAVARARLNVGADRASKAELLGL